MPYIPAQRYVFRDKILHACPVVEYETGMGLVPGIIERKPAEPGRGIWDEFPEIRKIIKAVEFVQIAVYSAFMRVVVRIDIAEKEFRA
jgi:hypothetical protein